ncbi:gliding motility-associated ABC transporter permease subunit GldF [Bacteroidota bacterium]
MISLLRKEISTYFNSISGYLVIILFLVINGLFLWVFPGTMNILDSGYASLQNYFIIAPWIFLFLIPAITMRSFAEEKRSGTIEFIFTKPLTNLEIILAKYFSSLILVFISIIPTLLYFLIVYFLGNPIGNLDTGGTWGSFIGLFFLASIYCAIGIFSSSLSDNQIISLLIAVITCFILYIGFDSISKLGIFEMKANVLLYFGMMEHYQSMSRGVIDSRDLVYFLSAITLFIILTQFKLSGKS